MLVVNFAIQNDDNQVKFGGLFDIYHCVPLTLYLFKKINYENSSLNNVNYPLTMALSFKQIL